MTVGEAVRDGAGHSVLPRKVMLAATLVAALVLAMLVPIGSAGAAPGPKITLCHATSSDTNPYVVITVDSASIVFEGHDGHADDVIPAFPGYAGKNLGLAGAPVECGGGGGGGGGDEVPVGDVTVAKTAATSLTRTHNWSIDKSVAPNPLKLYIGDTNKIATWDVDVTYLGTTDSAWAVAGTITATNAGNVPAEIDSFDDGLAGSTVDCDDVVLPTTLAPGDILACDYTVPLSGADSGTNTATATGTYLFTQAQAPVATADDQPFEVTGAALYNFTAPTVTEVNDTVTVADNHAGFALAYPTAASRTLNAADFNLEDEDLENDGQNFTYTQSFNRSSYPERGSTCVGETINNRAAIVGDNSLELGFDTAGLDVQVQCLVTGSGETATGSGYKWNMTKKAASNWFMYTPWTTNGHTGLTSGADIVAGQSYTIGKVTGSFDGTARKLSFEINPGWELKNVTNNVKVLPMTECTPQNAITYVQPGAFTVKRFVAPSMSAAFDVTAGLGTTAKCYGIHLDVVRVIPDPNF